MPERLCDSSLKPDYFRPNLVANTNREYPDAMPRYLVPIIAFGLAIMAATLLATVAHNGLGIPRATIRIDALAAAVFLLLAGGIMRKMSR
jgi:hypothetical protein